MDRNTVSTLSPVLLDVSKNWPLTSEQYLGYVKLADLNTKKKKERQQDTHLVTACTSTPRSMCSSLNRSSFVPAKTMLHCGSCTSSSLTQNLTFSHAFLSVRSAASQARGGGGVSCPHLESNLPPYRSRPRPPVRRGSRTWTWIHSAQIPPCPTAN